MACAVSIFQKVLARTSKLEELSGDHGNLGKSTPWNEPDINKYNIYLLLNLGRLVGLMAPSETLIGNSGTGPEIVVTKTRKLTLTGKR